MTDHIGQVYAKTEIELSGHIWSGAVYDEKQIGKRHDRLYRCVYVENKTQLSWSIRPGAVKDKNLIRQQHD